MGSADKAKFKVGDRVCVVRGGYQLGGSFHEAEIGDEFTVTEVRGDGGRAEIHTGRWVFYPFEITPAATGTLAIESGKFYKTRDGRKVGPMRRRRDLSFPWVADFKSSTRDPYVLLFREDGENYELRHLDLISEWVDEPTKTAGYTVPLCAFEDDFDICGYREPAGGDGEDDIVRLSVGELTAALADSLKVARKVGKPIKRGDLVVLARPALVTGINVDMRTVSIQTDGGNYSFPMAALTAA